MARGQELADRVPGYAWVSVGLWLLCTLVGFVIVFNLGILLPSMAEDLRLSPSEQGLLSSSAFWGNIALTVPLGWWTSRYAPKVVIGVALALGTVFLLLQARASTFGVLIAGRLAFGIALLAMEPPGALLIQQWFPPRMIILVNSLNNAVFGVVMGAGLVSIPLILVGLGGDWRTAFYIFGAAFAALTLLWFVLGRERTTEEYRRRQAPRETGLIRGALTHWDLWVAGFGFIGVTTAWSAFLSFFPTLMLTRYELPILWSGGILAVGAIVGGFASLGVGYAVAVVGKRNAIILFLGLVIVGTYIGMTLTGLVPVLVVLAFLNGVGWGFFPIVYSVPFQLPGIRAREVAIAVAFILTMVSVGTLVGPLTTGYLAEAFGDLRAALMVVAFAPLTLVVAGIFLRFRTQEGAQP